MSQINYNIDSQFNMSLYGYNKKQVDEYIHELLTYCWNLEEENKDLKKDLTSYSKQTKHQQFPELANIRWEEKEYSMLLGLLLQEDVFDYEGNIVAEKNTIITSNLIESLIAKGLYGELISAADPYTGGDRSVK